MKRCTVCERDEERVRLIDAIDSGEIVKICEECAFKEDIPLIRRPTAEQIEKSEQAYSVRHKLNKAPKEIKKEDIKQITERIFQKEIKPERKIGFELVKKKNQPINLIENYNWKIMMERKKRKMDRNQLAKVIGESETAIRLIEDRQLPDDALRIITKLEQYLSLKLRKDLSNNPMTAAPVTIIKMDKEAIKNINLDDLRKIRHEKENEARLADEKKAIKEEEIDSLIDQKNKKKSFFSGIWEWFNKDIAKKEELAEEVEKKDERKV